MLPLFSGAGKDQNGDGYQIRQHFDQLLVATRKTGDINAGDVKTAEYVGAEDRQARTPQGEDDDGDCQPAAVAESVVGPCARGVVHDEIKSAKTRDSAADAGREIFVQTDVDARRVCRGGIFSNGAKIQTDSGVLEEPLRKKRQNDCHVNQKTKGQEGFSKNAKVIGKEGDFRFVGVTRGQQGDRTAFAEELQKRAAVEVSKSHAKGGQRKTDYVLIGTQGPAESPGSAARDGG